MADILTQGSYMLLCALGSGVASVIVGYFAARVAAGLARRLRGEVFDKTLDFSLEEVDRVRFYVGGAAVDSLAGWIYLKGELLPNPGLVAQAQEDIG